MNKITTKVRKIATGFMAIALAFVIITNGSLPPRTRKDGPKGNNYLGYAIYVNGPVKP